MTFREVLLADGWYFKNARGSYNHHIHPTKKGKITIPNHRGNLDKLTVRTIFRQAGIE